jgi:hypothetical protein
MIDDHLLPPRLYFDGYSLSEITVTGGVHSTGVSPYICVR